MRTRAAGSGGAGGRVAYFEGGDPAVLRRRVEDYMRRVRDEGGGVLAVLPAYEGRRLVAYRVRYRAAAAIAGGDPDPDGEGAGDQAGE